jgi:hypothetical protein
MLLLRLELWAKKSGILSGTQFGIRKGKGTTDFLAVLTTEVKTPFQQKNQVLAAFLDITGAYDNVLIDILCRELNKERISTPLVFLLWDMMWHLCARAIGVTPRIGSISIHVQLSHALS